MTIHAVWSYLRIASIAASTLDFQATLDGLVRIEECGDLAIHDGALAVVEQLDLLRHDVQRVHLIMLRQQQRH